MIFDLLTPPQGPRGQVQNKIAVAHPIHVSNSHTSCNCLGGDSITDRGKREAITISPSLFLKKRGDNKQQKNLLKMPEVELESLTLPSQITCSKLLMS